MKQWKHKLFVTDQYSPAVCGFVSLLGFALSIILLYSVYGPNNQFPDYNELHFHAGEISNVKKTKYSVNINFKNDDSTFKYMSKGNAMGRVDDMVRQNGVVSIGYMPSERFSPTIFDIKIDDKKIRSYNEIKQAYKNDDQIVNWLAPLFALLGIYLGLVSYFSQKYIISSKHDIR
jgi:hypothetical protein